MNKTARQLEKVADALDSGDIGTAVRAAKSKWLRFQDDSVGQQQTHQLAECLLAPREQVAALFRDLSGDPTVLVCNVLMTSTLTRAMEKHLGCPAGITEHFSLDTPAKTGILHQQKRAARPQEDE